MRRIVAVVLGLIMLSAGALASGLPPWAAEGFSYYTEQGLMLVSGAMPMADGGVARGGGGRAVWLLRCINV